MCEQSEGSLVPLVAWRVRYLRSLQTAALPENARTAAAQSKSKKRKFTAKSAAKPARSARSAKRGGKTSAAGA
jgi:hypothetical protein